MKKETLFDAIDAIDNEIVEEALALEGKLRAQIRRERRLRISAISSIAACLCLVIIAMPIANWIKGTYEDGANVELPMPTDPSFLLSLPSPNFYTDMSEEQQKPLEWCGRSLTLNYRNSYDSWYTDAEFSTYEIKGEEKGSVTFIKGTDRVHKISTTMNRLSRAAYTEKSLKARAKQLVEAYSTIDTDKMEYSCTTNMADGSDTERIEGFAENPSVESYTVEYVQKLPIGYTSCYATVKFGLDGSVDIEMFNEDTAIINKYVESITVSDVYGLIEAAVNEYRNNNPQIEDLSCNVNERINIIKSNNNIYAVTKVTLFNDNDSDEYFLRVFIKTVESFYDSGSWQDEKKTSVSYEEISSIIEKMQKIYSQNKLIKLDQLDVFYHYLKECLDDFEENATKPLDQLEDEIVPRTGLSYRDLKAILSIGIIYDTDPNFQKGDFSGVDLTEYLTDYEAIITAMLIDHLFGMLPPENFSIKIQYTLYQTVLCSVNVKLSEEYCLMIQFIMNLSGSPEISSISYILNNSNGSFNKYLTPFEDIRAQVQG